MTPKESAVDLVTRLLKPRQPSGYKLRVVPEASRLDDDWWYVCVQPDRDDVRNYDYYDILAQVEQEIEDEHDVNVLLVPVAAESD